MKTIEELKSLAEHNLIRLGDENGSPASKAMHQKSYTFTKLEITKLEEQRDSKAVRRTQVGEGISLNEETAQLFLEWLYNGTLNENYPLRLGVVVSMEGIRWHLIRTTMNAIEIDEGRSRALTMVEISLVIKATKLYKETHDQLRRML